MSMDPELRKALERVIARLTASGRECCSRASRVPVEARSLQHLLEAVKSCRAVMVTFYSPTCPYCRAFAPIYAEAAEKYGDRMLFLRVNTYRLPEAAALFNIMGVPTTLGFANGSPVTLLYGYADLEELEAAVREALRKADCGEYN